MTFINFSACCEKTVSFYLAMEEYVARHVNEDDCFFMWQTEPSVIFGRNQLIEAEVNIDYCKEHGIRIYRRKSGGGCVYADMSNVMFSYITKSENVNFTFNRYINMVVLVLRKLGVEAVASGRNDIMVDGRKVSGNAFYHTQGRNIVHGTMLYDTDMQNMVGSITPSDEKLVSKGVKSVRQHIALLKDYLDISLEDFKDFVRNNLCDKEITLTDEDIAAIREIEKEYLTPQFVYGKNPKYSVVRRQRIEGAGDIEARIELKNGVIKALDLTGDYFPVGDISRRIIEPLIDIELTKESLEKALPERTDDIILNLQKKQLIELLTNKK